MSSAGEPTSSRRVFVVEDEIMIRMLLEDMLADLGYGVAASAGGLSEAITLARNSDFDLAILDVNLNGDAVYPVADLLMDRGLPEPYRDCPTLQKPFQLANLQHILTSIGR